RGAGVAGGHQRGRLAVSYEVRGDPERGIPLPPEGLRGGLGHADDLRGVADLEGEVVGLAAGQLALDGRLVAHEDDRGAVLPSRGDGALDDDGGPVIAAHRVNGDLHAPSTATISRPL